MYNELPIKVIDKTARRLYNINNELWGTKCKRIIGGAVRRIKKRGDEMSKKKILIPLFSLLLMFMLAACGSEEEAVEFWTPLTGDDGEYMDKLVEEFNETEPEYNVNHVITSDMYTKLYTVMNSGSGIPDMAIIHADRVPNFVNQDLLKPMDPIMDLQPRSEEHTS